MSFREPLFAIYDGQTALGYVFEKADRFEAVLVGGRSLGLWTTERAAAGAIKHADTQRCDPAGAT